MSACRIKIACARTRHGLAPRQVDRLRKDESQLRLKLVAAADQLAASEAACAASAEELRRHAFARPFAYLDFSWHPLGAAAAHLQRSHLSPRLPPSLVGCLFIPTSFSCCSSLGNEMSEQRIEFEQQARPLLSLLLSAIAQSIHVQRVSRCSLWQAARASAARMRPQAFRVAASQRGKPSARDAFRQTSIVLQCSRCALKSLRLAGRARAARISGARAASVTSTSQCCAVALACRHAIALS